MLEVIRGYLKERRNRVKENEVIDRLSFSIWKTCNRVLEEIEQVRAERGVELPTPRGETFLHSPKIDTRLFLSRLAIREIVEVKFEGELSQTEKAWSSRSDSTADEEELKFLREHGTGAKELAYYRFTEQGGRRVKREFEPSEVPLAPIVYGTQ